MVFNIQNRAAKGNWFWLRTSVDGSLSTYGHKLITFWFQLLKPFITQKRKEQNCANKLKELGKRTLLTVSLVRPSIPFKLWSLFCTTDNHFKLTHDLKPYNTHQNLNSKTHKTKCSTLHTWIKNSHRTHLPRVKLGCWRWGRASPSSWTRSSRRPTKTQINQIRSRVNQTNGSRDLIKEAHVR